MSSGGAPTLAGTSLCIMWMKHAIQFINTNQYEEFSALPLHGNSILMPVLAVVVYKLHMLCREQLTTNEKPIAIYRQNVCCGEIVLQSV